MGIYVLQHKMGINLKASKTTDKTNSYISSPTTEQHNKKVFEKYPHICKRTGRFKNHVTKSTFKEKFNSHNATVGEYPYIY